MAVTLTGTNFVVGATTVTVAGGGVTVNNVVVGSSDVADRQLRARSGRCWSPHGDGHDGRRDERRANLHDQLPPPGSMTFNFTGGPQTFTVPAGVVSVTILATGAQGGLGFGPLGGTGGLGGRTTATVSVTPGASLTVRVGGVGPWCPPPSATAGGFNGGGGSTGTRWRGRRRFERA